MKIFISYSSADRTYAFELFGILEGNGHDAWLDYFDIMPSEKLEQELSHNISQADVLCIIFSPNSMSSKWVEYEIRVASKNHKKGMRVLGIIVHSCKIPDFVSDIIHLDARNGLNGEVFIARLLRAIDKTEIEDKEQLLDKAYREELAKLTIIDRSNKELPYRATELEKIANRRVNEVNITIDPNSLAYQEKVIYELILNGTRGSFAPMHFLFTTFEEGHTWPEEFGASEPSFKDFFMARKPKVDGKFVWYGEVFDFIDTIYVPEIDDPPAFFSFTFNGKEFNTNNYPLYTKAKLEFPTIRKLLSNNFFFELIAHFPSKKEKRKSDVFNSEINLRFQIRLKGEEKPLTLFKSRHNFEEELAYSSDFMKSNPNMIYRELLMNGFSEEPIIRNYPKQKLIEALRDNKEVQEQDHSMGGFYAKSEGDLYYFRANYREAYHWYSKAIILLEPVIKKYPTFKEALIYFFCWKRLADCLIDNKDLDVKAGYLNNLVVIGRHLIAKFPNEIDYKRLLAIGLLHNAEIENYQQKTEQAAKDLMEGIALYEEIYREIPTAENYMEQYAMKTAAVQHYFETPVAHLVPIQQWEIDLAALNPDTSEILAEERATNKETPVWLKEATDPEWPVKMFNSPLLRYSIAVPEKWAGKPILSNTQMEVNHLFKGRTPSEFLSISFMDKAISGRMTNWVDADIQMTGFPILEISLDTNPSVKDWFYEGQFDRVAQHYVADEAHCYSGIIELNDKNHHRARIYILLLRKKQFAWKFILSFETAMFPGMPAAIIYNEDHIRAGCTFGKLTLE